MPSPRFKVYTSTNKYVAACEYAEDAAAVVANYTAGSIRDGHSRKVWTEGKDGDAGASYDAVAALVWERIEAKARVDYDKVYGAGAYDRFVARTTEV